jgi:hypothetical protein
MLSGGILTLHLSGEKQGHHTKNEEQSVFQAIKYHVFLNFGAKIRPEGETAEFKMDYFTNFT